MLDYQQSVVTTSSSTDEGCAPTPTSSPDHVLAPIAIKKAPGQDGTIIYGLVARVAMSQPGFGFRVEHDLPVGVELVEARPKAKVVGDHLIWQFGRVDPGQEVRLQVTIRPDPETVIKPEELAIFTATYSHNLYFQVPVVRPRLTARIIGPATMGVGEDGEFHIEVANIGTCVADDVRATVFVPREFWHEGGTVFKIAIGSLKNGEMQRARLPMLAVDRGRAILRATVTGPDDKEAAIEFPIDVR